MSFIESTLPNVAIQMPEQLQSAVRYAASYLPAEVNLLSAAQFMLFFTAISLVFGIMGRVVLGKRSSLNHSLSAAIGILFIYVLSVIVYTFKPWQLDSLLSPLPFVTFTEEYLVIFPIGNAKFPALCAEALSLLLLAFLVNLLDSFLPKGESFITWYLMRFITVVFSIGLHFLVRQLFHLYLPDFLVLYAPMVLLLILIFMLLSGVLSLLLGLLISMTNPFLGAMYTFFFSSVVGKQLSKAVFSSSILFAVVYLLEFFGYTILSITAGALIAYIPLVILLLILWYVIGHVL